MRGKPRSAEASFAVLHTHCAALDVHKDSIMACALTPGEGDEPRSEVRQSGATTGELEALGRWLLERGVTHAAMEPTGVYCPTGTASVIPGLFAERIRLAGVLYQ